MTNLPLFGRIFHVKSGHLVRITYLRTAVYLVIFKNHNWKWILFLILTSDPTFNYGQLTAIGQEFSTFLQVVINKDTVY